jgi:glutaconate CoA-transferase subunit A
MGYRTGKALVFTDLCVFHLDQTSRELTVIETMPGVTMQQIRDGTGFAVTFDAGCREISQPSNDTLAVLRNRIDPLGLRRLEFVSAKERGALITEILAADRGMVERCIAAQRSVPSARS